MNDIQIKCHYFDWSSEQHSCMLTQCYFSISAIDVPEAFIRTALLQNSEDSK